MAFWGVEVKPGKPVTHVFDRTSGRLRITQATLNIGSSTDKSLVQCNIEDKSPVLLCALLPGKTESCHLDLEFEESNEVVFSVLGPRSVYLTGYYVGNVLRSNLNEDSESYGEDIANTETEESTPHSEEDKYEDSFIDDGGTEVLPYSPVSSSKVDEELLDKKKPKDGKGIRKRLKKKYQSIDSDDDTSSRKQNIGYSSGVQTDDEDEDNFLLSVFRTKRASEKKIPDAREKDGTVEAGNRKTEDTGTHDVSEGNFDALVVQHEPEREADPPSSSLQPSDEGATGSRTDQKKKGQELLKEGKTPEGNFVGLGNAATEEVQQDEVKVHDFSEDMLITDGKDHKSATDNEQRPENGIKSRRKRKKGSVEVGTLETKGSNNRNGLKKDEIQQDNKDQDLLVRNKHGYSPTAEMEIDLLCNSSLASTKMGFENGPKPKKRKKVQAVDGKSGEGIQESCNNISEKDPSRQNAIKTENINKNLHVTIQQDCKPTNDKCGGIYPEQLANGCQTEENKSIKKKKRKSKHQDIAKKENMDVPILVEEEKNGSFVKLEDNSANATSSQMRTLSNGLIIEELEAGEPGGKTAAPGKKVKVHYVGKFKEDGKIFDSNINKAPCKFYLGDEDVIKGWNVGIDGMRVGDKRRLIIPPSMGYGSSGAAENIPPNSWLVYDVELISVR